MAGLTYNAGRQAGSAGEAENGREGDEAGLHGGCFVGVRVLGVS